MLSSLQQPAPEDYYTLLGIDPKKATADEVKAAYKKLQKLIHPDIIGPSANNLAVILNASLMILMDESKRRTYDIDLAAWRKGQGSFDGRPVSTWSGSESETRAVFVSETECIGCRACTNCASKTFAMEEEHGRARVMMQWADDEDTIQEAIESCPVDCINIVPRSTLALLEFVMKGCKRENVGIMGRRRSGNFGPELSNEDPFDRAATYLKQRRDVNVEQLNSRSGTSIHTEELSAAIAGSCLALPLEVRQKVWPEFFDAGDSTQDEFEEDPSYSQGTVISPSWPLDESPPPNPIIFL